jgi:hypothetical protein
MERGSVFFLGESRNDTEGGLACKRKGDRDRDWSRRCQAVSGRHGCSYWARARGALLELKDISERLARAGSYSLWLEWTQV